MADALRPDLRHQPHPVPAVAIGRALRITRVAVGSGQTRLAVLRGNSGSGKSTVAKAPRAACGQEMAWVSLSDRCKRNMPRELRFHVLYM